MAYLASRGGDTPGVVEHGVEVEGALAQRRVLVSSELIFHGLQSHCSADVVIVVWDAVVGDLHEVTRDVPSVDILVRLNGVEDVLSTTTQVYVCVFWVRLCCFMCIIQRKEERESGVVPAAFAPI